MEGTTFSARLNETRREVGALLLADTGLYFKEVAHLLDYENVNSYSRVFRQPEGFGQSRTTLSA